MCSLCRFFGAICLTSYSGDCWIEFFDVDLLEFAFTCSIHSVYVAKPVGCFKDTGRRAIPGVDGRYPIVRGYYRRRKEAIQKCGAVALMRGYRAFAVQHQGWCATGPRAHVTYKKYGRSNRCRNGKGGPWANDVYVVSGKYIFWSHWLLKQYEVNLKVHLKLCTAATLE